MEALNMDWLAFSTHDTSLNNDLAIRRFCQARFAEEQGDWEEILNEIELCSPTETTHTTGPTSLDNSEIDEFVESFINMENYDEKGDEALDRFHDKEDMFCPENTSKNGSLVEPFEAKVGEIVPSVEELSHGVDQGLHLVHMLLACAEAVGCRDTRLAESMLSQIQASVSPFGDPLQRVSYFFASGLKSRLSLLQNVNANGTFIDGGGDFNEASREERMEAFRLLYQTTPFIAFGFMVANEAICQSASGKDWLHIIDFGMENVLQWPSLIRNLASRPEGPPKQLRITGLTDDQNPGSELEFDIKTLVEEATSLGIALEFQIIAEKVTPLLLTKEKMDIREGETLFVNGFMSFHKLVKESRGSLKAILQALKKLSPTLLTVVEQDANHNGPFFLGRFLEALHYYSAIFDSLEASLPRNSPQRVKIEAFRFGEEIRNIVACEGSSRIARHERADQWRRQLGRAGFQIMGLKCVSQATMMLSVYGCEGFTLASEKGCLLLGWKGRPVMLASAWQIHNVHSS